MSIKKQYLKSKPTCKVTFRVPKQAAPWAKTVHLVGEFNNWDTTATPMQGLKSGDFKTMLELQPNKAYQFRYLLDQQIWQNYSQADQYVPTPYGDSDNSVIIL